MLIYLFILYRCVVENRVLHSSLLSCIQVLISIFLFLVWGYLLFYDAERFAFGVEIWFPLNTCL